MTTSHVLYDSFGRGFNVAEGSDNVPSGGVRVGAVGASITTANGARPGNELSVQGYLAWAALLSEGAIKYAGHAGAGGATSTNVAATHLPALLALPGAPFHYVVLDAFTNNMSSDALFDQGKLDLASMVSSLQARGIAPILSNVPPRTDGTTAEYLRIAKWNAYLARYAELNSLIHVDWHSRLVDPATGEYAAGMLLTGDTSGLHPSPAGAKLMGQALVDAMPPAPHWRPVMRAVDEDPIDLIAHGLFLTDTAGVGTGFTSALSEGDDFAADCDDPAAAGNWQAVAQTGGLTWLVSAPAFTFVPGHRYRWSGLFEVVAVDAGASVNLQIVDGSGNTISTVEATQIGWHTEEVDGSFELDFTCPAGVVTGLFSLRVNGGAATARVAQVSLVDLTALGAASF